MPELLRPEDLELRDELERELLKEPETAKPQDLLYHYTTAAGLKGIIEKKQIWATHFNFTNDTTEVRHGEECVLEEMKAVCRSAGEEHRLGAFLADLIPVYEKVRFSKIANVFVASMSEDGDQLSQWRAYGADGAGYSVGFRSFHLPEGDRPNAQVGLALYRCTYDENEFRQAIRDNLQQVADALERCLRRTAHEDAQHALLRCAQSGALIRIAAQVPRLKNGAFFGEHEWRLVAFPNRDREREVVDFKTTERGLVPYVPLPLTDGGPESLLSLGKVCVGPGENAELAWEAAKMLLQYRGYDPSSLLVRSGIPYRKVR